MNPRTVLAGLLALGLSGCPFISEGPVPAFPDDRGDVGPLPDRGPEPEPDPDGAYTWLHIVDSTAEGEGRGGDGADICGIRLECPDEDGARLGEEASLFLGAGQVCDGTTLDGPCEAGFDRTDPAAALDDGATCRPHVENEAPPSDFVSLGFAGELAVQFARDLRGCAVTVVELVDGGFEAYDVYVCTGDTLSADGCLGDGDAVAGAQGGTITFDVPLR